MQWKMKYPFCTNKKQQICDLIKPNCVFNLQMLGQVFTHWESLGAFRLLGHLESKSSMFLFVHVLCNCQPAPCLSTRPVLSKHKVRIRTLACCFRVLWDWPKCRRAAGPIFESWFNYLFCALGTASPSFSFHTCKMELIKPMLSHFTSWVFFFF